METVKKKNGVVFVLLSALCFSVGGLFLKMVPWSALSINGGRAMISTIVIASYMAATKHKLVVNKQVLLGAVCVVAEMILYVFANKLTTAANAIVLQFTAPIFIILFMWIFFHQKPRKLDIITCVIVFIGIIIFFVDGLASGGMLGNVLAVCSGAFYAVVFMLNAFPKGDSLSSMVLAHGASALIGIPFIFQETDFSFSPVFIIILLGIIQQSAAFLFLSKGLENTPPVAASLVSSLEPILNPVWVAIFYGEIPSLVAVGGAAIVIGAVVVYNLKNAKLAKKAEQAAQIERAAEPGEE